MFTKNHDLTQGNISKNIFTFSIPLMIGTLIQVLFNMTDQIVLGQMAGGNAVASVSATSTVVHLIVNFFVGLSGGVTIVLARSIGMKDDERSKQIISTAMISAVLIGVFASLIALPLGAPLLNITKCPEECYDGAFTYTMIYYLSIPAMTVYNYGAAILRVSGDSRRPTLYLVLAGALNLVMNIILCIVMKNKVAAVALATVASQILGAILTTRRLVMMKDGYRLDLRRMTFKKELFLKIMRYGIPTGLNSSLYCIANLQIQKALNSFGPAALAGQSAGASIESIVAAFTGAFGTAASTMIGQNLGAGKPDRVKKSIFVNMGYSVAISTALSIIVYLFRAPIVKLYVPDMPEALYYATVRMQQVLLLYGMNAYNNVLSSTLNAFGYSVFSMISNIMSTIVFRTIWMQLIYPHNPTFRMLMVCFSLAWSINAVMFTVAFAIVYTRYKKGKVRKI